MNERLRDVLERAAQRKAVRVNGKEMNAHWLKTVMDASFKTNGFGKDTLEDALNLLEADRAELEQQVADVLRWYRGRRGIQDTRTEEEFFGDLRRAWAHADSTRDAVKR